MHRGTLYIARGNPTARISTPCAIANPLRPRSLVSHPVTHPPGLPRTLFNVIYPSQRFLLYGASYDIYGIYMYCLALDSRNDLLAPNTPRVAIFRYHRTHGNSYRKLSRIKSPAERGGDLGKNTLIRPTKWSRVFGISNVSPENTVR